MAHGIHQDLSSLSPPFVDLPYPYSTASLRYKKRVEAACSLVSSFLNAVSFGAAGSALQGILSLALSSIADFGDLDNLFEVAKDLGASSTVLDSMKDMADDMKDMTIKDMLDQGIELAQDKLADSKLDEAIDKKNAAALNPIVLLGLSAA